MNTLEKAYQLTRKITKDGNAPHIGSALSVLDILYVIYFKFYNAKKNSPRIVLSKGHAVAALYSILYLKGILTKKELLSYHKDAGLPAHADHHVKGIQVSTGSLGHGLPIACGMALANPKERVICIMGDGECEEGSVWEAVNFAAMHYLKNLTIIVDCNKLQAYDETRRHGADITELFDKFWAFGCKSYVCDGHNLKTLEAHLNMMPFQWQPTVILANTIKGKGLENEGEISCHYR